MKNVKFYLSVLERLDDLEFECLSSPDDVSCFIDISEDFYRLRETLYSCLHGCLVDEK